MIAVGMGDKPQIHGFIPLAQKRIEVVAVFIGVAAVDHHHTAVGAVDDIGHHLCVRTVSHLQQCAAAEI